MKLLKLITIIFVVYFVRRFIQLYKAMKTIQEKQQQQASAQSHKNNNDDVIEADFKIVK